MTYSIRLIQPEDNAAIAQLIVQVMAEYGCSGEGYACNDPETQAMSEAYQSSDSRYWVVVEDSSGRIVGGGGFSRLKGTTETEAVCELQKLYFLPEVRGQGVGKRLLSLAINQAARLGYRDMYLESLPQMEKAMSMYEKFDFQPLIAPMGNTGHYNCTIFMCRSLEPATSSRS